jgi:hypothetical protein
VLWAGLSGLISKQVSEISVFTMSSTILSQNCLPGREDARGVKLTAHLRLQPMFKKRENLRPLACVYVLMVCICMPDKHRLLYNSIFAMHGDKTVHVTNVARCT